MKRLFSIGGGLFLSLMLIASVNAATVPQTNLTYALSGSSGSHTITLTATLISGSTGSVQNAVIDLTCYAPEQTFGGVHRVTWVGSKTKVASASFYVGDRTVVIDSVTTFIPENCPQFVGKVYKDGSESTLISNVLEGTIP